MSDKGHPTTAGIYITGAATFAMGFLVCWALQLGTHNSRPFDMPAWVQAVGSVLAILVAIAVPAWQQRRQHQEKVLDEHRKGDAVAIALTPEIDAYRRGAERYLEVVTKSLSSFSIRNAIPRDSFEFSRTINAFRLRFYLLGQDAELTDQFVASLFWLQVSLKAFYANDYSDQLVKQAMVDCKNTIDLALRLSNTFEKRVNHPDRSIGQ